MAEKKTTRIQRQNKHRIMQAALEVFSTSGYRGATIDQIAKTAKISKSSIFYYFPSKTEIYISLLTETLEEWLEPLRVLDHDGDPADEIMKYVDRKLQMSRDNPKASRLFANEIMHGAPNISDILHGSLKQLVDEKCVIIQQWIDEGKLVSVSPYHLIFMIWAATQHYADFEVQVDAIVDECMGRDQCFDEARETLRTVFLNGLLPR